MGQKLIDSLIAILLFIVGGVVAYCSFVGLNKLSGSCHSGIIKEGWTCLLTIGLCMIFGVISFIVCVFRGNCYIMQQEQSRTMYVIFFLMFGIALVTTTVLMLNAMSSRPDCKSSTGMLDLLLGIGICMLIIAVVMLAINLYKKNNSPAVEVKPIMVVTAPSPEIDIPKTDPKQLEYIEKLKLERLKKDEEARYAEVNRTVSEQQENIARLTQRSRDCNEWVKYGDKLRSNGRKMSHSEHLQYQTGITENCDSSLVAKLFPSGVRAAAHEDRSILNRSLANMSGVNIPQTGYGGGASGVGGAGGPSYISGSGSGGKLLNNSYTSAYK